MENNYYSNQQNYNPYTNPQQGFQEMPPYKQSAFAGFGVTMVKTVTIALVFGLVAELLELQY